MANNRVIPGEVALPFTDEEQEQYMRETGKIRLLDSEYEHLPVSEYVKA